MNSLVQDLNTTKIFLEWIDDLCLGPAKFYPELGGFIDIYDDARPKVRFAVKDGQANIWAFNLTGPINTNRRHSTLKGRVVAKIPLDDPDSLKQLELVLHYWMSHED